MVQILFAILAGVLTIGAPCILPVLPIILGNSIGQQSKWRPVSIAAGFILTFTAISLLFAAFPRIFGASPQTLREVGIILLAIFGLLLIFPVVFERLTLKLSGAINSAASLQTKFSGNWGGFVTGLTLGLIWTPCAGPVLGAILTLISTSQDLATAGVLLFFYALGAGIPMLLIAYGGQFASTKVRAIAKYTPIIQRVFGFLILALAIAMYFDYDLILQAKLIEYYPGIVPKY